jgi:hypothetical protein
MLTTFKEVNEMQAFETYHYIFVQHALKYFRTLEKQLRSIIFDTSFRRRYRMYCACMVNGEICNA